MRKVSIPEKDKRPSQKKVKVIAKKGIPFIFIRSSTNCEGLPNFIGAGLYDTYVFPENVLEDVDIPESEQGKDYVLTEEQAREVIEYALKIEDRRGAGQDIECGFVGADYWLTQVTEIPVITSSTVLESEQELGTTVNFTAMTSLRTTQTGN